MRELVDTRIASTPHVIVSYARQTHLSSRVQKAHRVYRQLLDMAPDLEELLKQPNADVSFICSEVSQSLFTCVPFRLIYPFKRSLMTSPVDSRGNVYRAL